MLKRSLWGAIGALCLTVCLTVFLMAAHTVSPPDLPGAQASSSSESVAGSYAMTDPSAVEVLTGVSDVARLDTFCGGGLDCMAMMAPYVEQMKLAEQRSTYHRTPLPNGVKDSIRSLAAPAAARWSA